MALLDFIRNRNTSPQQAVANKPQEQKPETAKEMYARQAAQEKASQKTIADMPPAQRARMDAIKAELQKASQHIDGQAKAQPKMDTGGSREALRQNMTGQDKTAPALSPTSAQAGKPETEKTPAKETPKPTPRPQTLPRPRPSGER
jgi:hypothetical protein